MVIHPFFDGKIGYDETLILAIPILECRCSRLRGLEGDMVSLDKLRLC